MSVAFPEQDQAALDVEIIKRGGFYAFFRKAWHVIETVPYVDNWHAEEVCNHCEAVTYGIIKNLLINVPPGTSKSTIVSIAWPAWEWTIKPETRFIYASFDGSLALKHAEAMFNLVTSPWYVARWGHLFPEGQSQFAMGDYTNRFGGFRFSTSVGGKGTGRHAHRRVFDDPNKPADALGTGKAVSAVLESTNHWWKNTMGTRRVDPGNFSSVGVMQRIHEMDLSDQCIRDGYVHLCLPMRYDPARHCDTPLGGDRRTLPGELLHPSRYDQKTVDEMVKRDLGEAVAAAQLDQNPAPAGGLIFKDDNFRHFTLNEFPFEDLDVSCLSIDCSFKDIATADYVALEVWGRKGAKILCYDSVLERLDLDGTINQALLVLSIWKTTSILVEDKANGPSVIAALRRRLPNVIALDPKTSKPARAQAANTFYAAHSVYHLADAPWLGRKEQNLKHYPKARNDDDVDTTSQGVLWLGENSVSDFASLMAAVKKDLENKGLQISSFNTHYTVR
jgi:predicted phage terminase large subunit-like protein